MKRSDVRTGLCRFFALSLALVASMASTSCSGYASQAGFELEDKSIIVRKGGDLQAALDKATPGDTIFLEAGATFRGAFKLPKKPGAEFITIRSSADDRELPPPGTRLDPAKYKDKLATIISDVPGEPAILGVDGAHHFRFIAIDFGPTIGGMYNIIQLGTGSEKSVDDLPHHIEFDRVWIHGSPTEGQRRGIAANGRHINVVNSHISEIKRKGDESQGIAVWASDGPVIIVNNFIEAAAENILFGGAGSYLKLVPTDCIVDSNHLSKPLEWLGTDWVVKNLFEIKNGRRITVTNNLMTNNWAMGQDGNALLFTTRADNGNATIIEDIEFSGNIVRGSSGGLNILGGEGAGGHRLTIRNNIFDDIGHEKWGGGGNLMKVTDWNGLVIENNTVMNAGSIAVAYGRPVRGFVFRSNIIFEGEYGFFGDDLGPGQKAIDRYFPGGTVTGNIIIGGSKESYREPNIFLSAIGQVGFENPSKGDYRLRSTSAYIKAAPGGKPIGAYLNPNLVGTKAPKIYGSAIDVKESIIP